MAKHIVWGRPDAGWSDHDFRQAFACPTCTVERVVVTFERDQEGKGDTITVDHSPDCPLWQERIYAAVYVARGDSLATFKERCGDMRATMPAGTVETYEGPAPGVTAAWVARAPRQKSR